MGSLLARGPTESGATSAESTQGVLISRREAGVITVWDHLHAPVILGCFTSNVRGFIGRSNGNVAALLFSNGSSYDGHGRKEQSQD